MSAHIYSVLSLGDSYTIGEGLPLHESFPYQMLQMLRRKGYSFHAPEIVAQTGWTTTELAEHLIHNQLEDQYDFVTLLIGVNNQYRSLATNDFADDFEFLVKKAIHLSKGHAQCVIVISVPDWGTSPFAKDRNTRQIGDEINSYNEINSAIAFKYDCGYVDITTGKSNRGDAELYTADGLHYSAEEYGRWALEIAENIIGLIA